MANAVYSQLRNQLMQANIDLTTAVIKAQCVDAADYTFSDAHTSLADIPALGRVGNAVTLSNQSVTGTVFDADNVLINNVSGDQFEAVVLYVDTGVEATSTLCAYLDNSGTLSVTPTGADIVIEWNASGIFQI